MGFSLLLDTSPSRVSVKRKGRGKMKQKNHQEGEDENLLRSWSAGGIGGYFVLFNIHILCFCLWAMFCCLFFFFPLSRWVGGQGGENKCTTVLACPDKELQYWDVTCLPPGVAFFFPVLSSPHPPSLILVASSAPFFVPFFSLLQLIFLLWALLLACFGIVLYFVLWIQALLATPGFME